MRPIIAVEHLSKAYRISRGGAGYGTLRESVARALSNPFRTAREQRQEAVVALDDVTFELAPGEVVGVIGRNGAGKSTLLKVLSRITPPSAGVVRLWGRVASLLEVGTGFHGELTGRENIYLSGAILGMRRAEIARAFDGIVEFADVQRFLDTPVKRYSSGMYLRLAFSVAAHLETEILLVDEVLAVGDVRFQKRCLTKIDEVARSGRTVLFVSHNMAAIESLCNRCLLVDRGRLSEDGLPNAVITSYLRRAMDAEGGSVCLRLHARRAAGWTPIMTEVALFSESAGPTSWVKSGDPLTVRVAFENNPARVRPYVSMVVKTAQGMPVFGVNNRFTTAHYDRPPSSGAMACRFETLPLAPGTYFVDLCFEEDSAHLDVIPEAISFEVLPRDVYGTGRLPPPAFGPILWHGTWELQTFDDTRNQTVAGSAHQASPAILPAG
jgi:lipopolysaccharide transport system ATP-binding protein